MVSERVLDHGYFRVIEHWGSDERIVEAARMSTDKGFLGWDAGPCPLCKGEAMPECLGCAGKGTHRGDAALLRFLYSNKHSTPFEFAGLVVEVQAPIMVFREWHRHRTQSYSELSARYTPMPNVHYMPTTERLLLNANAGNKQAGAAKGAGVLDLDTALEFQARLAALYEASEECYQWALAAGVPKELARLATTVGRYSRMRAQANLRNWLGFVTLRSAPNAQWEIRQYSHKLAEALREVFPRTLALFDEVGAA